MLIHSSAEHRGPGVHHGFDDNSEDFDMPMDLIHQNAPLRLPRGIILLPDGSGAFQVHQSNEQDTEMFDHDEEDKDLESQVTKGTPSGSEDEGDGAEERRLREGTPAPQSSSTDTLPSKTHSETSSTLSKPSEAEQTKPEEKSKAEATAETKQ